MKVLINGNLFSLPETPATMGDFYDLIVAQPAYQGSYVTKIMLDGRLIDFPAPEEPFPPSGFNGEQIEVRLEESGPILNRSLTDGLELLHLISEELSECGPMFRDGNFAQANGKLLDLMDKIGLFLEYMAEVVRFSQYAIHAVCSFEKMDELSNEALELMRKILAAQENNDFVLIADLLEFELTPFLQTWEKFFSAARPASRDGQN